VNFVLTATALIIGALILFAPLSTAPPDLATAPAGATAADGSDQKVQTALTVQTAAPKRDITAAVREVTAYNVGDPAQTAGDPCIGASGKNLCQALESGIRTCAANFVPLGTRLRIDSIGSCVVEDRMHRRFSHRVDVAMKLAEKERAIRFGLRRLRVAVLDDHIRPPASVK